MYKTVSADQDTYVTNKIVKGERKTGSNVGGAGSLDLFKLYDVTRSGSIPNTELSRLLLHFDLSKIRELMSEGRLSPGDPSFWCKLILKDVYGGQPVPNNFTVSVFPLSSSFVEGLGRDTSYYSDYDVCNWLSASVDTVWVSGGCGSPCDASIGGGDYITSSLSLPSTEVRQFFKEGTEDLSVDVTSIVSATLSGELPDAGFRVSFLESLESNARTYFVKRFGSRTVYDESKRPRLVFGFDDSMSDDTQNLTVDTDCNIFLRNYSGGRLTNILSGSGLDVVTGSSCIVLKLLLPVSGGTYDLPFIGSQFSYGTSGDLYVSGTYSAPVTILSSDPIISQHLTASGSLKVTPVWTSLDGTVSYLSGSNLSIQTPRRTSAYVPKNFVVSVIGIKDEHRASEESLLRVNIFDNTSPLIKVSRVPVELPGVVVKNVYYQVRDSVTEEIVVPFDAVKNSTKVSSDSDGMFFKMYFDCLLPGRTYVFDLMIDENGVKSTYKNSSSVFRVIT